MAASTRMDAGAEPLNRDKSPFHNIFHSIGDRDHTIVERLFVDARSALGQRVKPRRTLEKCHFDGPGRPVALLPDN